MAYPLANNDQVEVQIVGSLHGQETRNVFHYYVSSAGSDPDGRTALIGALDDFETDVYELVRQCMSSEWHCVALTIQKILPFRYRLISIIAGEADGAVADNSLPSTTAAVVSRFAEQAGRRFQGRIFIPAVPVTWEDNSKIAPARLPAYQAVAIALPQDLLTGTGLTLSPTLQPGGGTPSEQKVVASIARDILRVQRRREVGRGS